MRIINSRMLLPVAALGLLFCSCQKDELPFDVDSAPINFSVEQTKASVTSVDGMKESAFVVNGTVGSTSLFSGQNVEWSSTSSEWTYSPAKFWKANSTYNFRAVWPATALSATTTYSDNLTSATVSNFTVLSVQASQVDLLMSDITPVNTGSNVTGLSATLSFRHILCQVLLKIKQNDNDDDVFHITGITLTGVKDRGSYTVGSGIATSGTWNTSGSMVLTFTKNYSTPGFDLSSAGVKGNYQSVWDGGLLLIPQTISGDVIVNIDYKVTHGGDTRTKFVSLHLPKPDGKEGWEPGMTYTYQIVMSEQYNIMFSNPVVEPWGTAQASGTIVIK
mgnify:CR=1 FL=1